MMAIGLQRALEEAQEKLGRLAEMENEYKRENRKCKKLLAAPGFSPFIHLHYHIYTIFTPMCTHLYMYIQPYNTNTPLNTPYTPSKHPKTT